MDLLDSLHIKQLTDQVNGLVLQNARLQHENESLQNAVVTLLEEYSKFSHMKEKILCNHDLYHAMDYLSNKDIANMFREKLNNC
jgi:hypothetical protein|nr:MAG TPA: Initiation-control protein YabA, DnaA, DnaN, Zinc finger.7A [Caudoviricetes sp.]